MIKIANKSQLLVEIGTATRTQDRSITSSIKPKCDNWFIVDSLVSLHVGNMKLFLFWFVGSQVVQKRKLWLNWRH